MATPIFRYRTLALSIGLLCGSVQADTAGQTDEEVTVQGNTEHVTVIGQAARLDKALKEQRRSDSISNVVSADGVAQLPDANAAEALQRVPGVTVERDQGEGRYVTVRGLGAGLNAVSINGSLLPSPEGDTRAVAMDVLPSELVQSMSVVKTLTPDMDANSLGGTIEVRSLSAFDHEDAFNTFSVSGSHDDNTGEISPKLSGALTRKFSIGDGTDNFGVALAASWEDRDFGSDNVETDGGWDDLSAGTLEEVLMRKAELTRKRQAVGLNFDFKPDDMTSFYLRTLYSSFEDTENGNNSLVAFDPAVGVGESGAGEAELEFKNRTETQEIHSVVLGGEKLLETWTLNGQVGYSHAFQDTPNEVEALFVGGPFNGSFNDSRKPIPSMEDAYYQAGSYKLDEVKREDQLTTDTEANIKLDFARDYLLGANPSQLKFGTKVSRREKDNDVEVSEFDTDDLASTDLEDYYDDVDYGLAPFGPGVSNSAIRAAIAGMAGARNEVDSRLEDFEMREDTNALYVMNSVDLGDWYLLAGVRYESTSFEADGVRYDDASGEWSANRSDKTDDYLLPGLHARYRLDSDTLVRAAFTQSVVRPSFEQLAPYVYLEDDDGDLKAEFGNPDLDPLESSNLDLGIERYMGRLGLMSAYLFYKDIKNYTYATDLAGTGEWAAYDEAATFANGDDASIYGLELAFSRKFGNFLTGANLTLSESEATIDGFNGGDYRSRDIDLPLHSDTVANLTVGWENELVSLRLAGNYKSSYLEEISSLDEPERDRYVDDAFYLDFSAKYYVTDQLQVNFDALNLTDEVFYAYLGKERFNAQYEEYGPTFKLGLTWTGF